MRRGLKGLKAIVGIAATCGLLLSPASAAAGPPAGDQYILTLPGVDQTQVGGSTRSVTIDPEQKAGVLGENEPTPTMLATLGSAAGSPGFLAAALGVTLLIGLLVRGARRR